MEAPGNGLSGTREFKIHYGGLLLRLLGTTATRAVRD